MKAASAIAVDWAELLVFAVVVLYTAAGGMLIIWAAPIATFVDDRFQRRKAKLPSAKLPWGSPEAYKLVVWALRIVGGLWLMTGFYFMGESAGFLRR
jgi:polyferredoxin